MRQLIVVAVCFMITALPARSQQTGPLEYAFDKHYGQVEVGGVFAGAEFHNSRPLPSRISLYYPVANSIDLSTDYWKRGDSRPVAVGMQVDEGERRWIGREPWSYVVSPHKVVFRSSEDNLELSMKYEFMLRSPAMVFTLTVKNLFAQSRNIDLYVHLKPGLRTCQTYTRRDSARTAFNKSFHSIRFDYDDSDAGRASVFVENVGIVPFGWSTDAAELAITDSGTSRWSDSDAYHLFSTSPAGKHNAAAAFEYKRRMAPGDSAAIILIIGSCSKGETAKLVNRLSRNWRKNVAAYDEMMVKKSERAFHFITGDPMLDGSATWAAGILAANFHYIDHAYAPMPCPAEYNFFFTHDVLMTDLARVNFDCVRVQSDLQYIVSHAKDNIIPHAYYWRDDGFKTEYCTPDNWNHFWFILASAAYMRHSLLPAVPEQSFPLLTKSLDELLTQVRHDNLMYAYRPDWWDIGHIEGPRAYTTILMIRALREYVFLSSYLHHDDGKLSGCETLADSMQQALYTKLWDPKLNYIMNYNGDVKDKHYYMGSLLAPAYGLLDSAVSLRLLQTASEHLLDSILGVRTAMPPDFADPDVIKYYKLAGEEAGKPYFYINGGVWPHDNSWYAIALNAAGNPDKGLDFVKRTMTLEGITHSPMGQPAMYEYRYADPSSKEYGAIDKPSFLWAGGFYLKTLYDLFGARENVWNLSFDPHLPRGYSAVRYTVTLGRSKSAGIFGSGKYLQSLVCGNETLPSLVLPEKISAEDSIAVTFGAPKGAYLKSINAILIDVSDSGSAVMKCTVRSFNGHATVAVIVSPENIGRVEVEGNAVSDIRRLADADGMTEYAIGFTGSATPQHVRIAFAGERK